MTFASEDLRNEYEGILFGLNILDQMVMQLDSGKDVAKDDYVQMVDFLRLFADKCHHGKEEGLFFPALEKVGIPKENGPIGQMLIEHEQGRMYIKEMTEALAGEALDNRAFSTAAEHYANLLRSHIQKENMVLFAMGDQLLAPELQNKLLQEFEHFEETVMGPGIHDQLHTMLNTFEKKYLKGN